MADTKKEDIVETTVKPTEVVEEYRVAIETSIEWPVEVRDEYDEYLDEPYGLGDPDGGPVED